MDFGDAIRPLAKLSDVAGSGTPGANLNFLAADINAGSGTLASRPWPVTSRLTVTIALASGGKFFLTINGGAQLAFNGGTSLTSNCLYAFSFGARPSDTYNFQTDSAGAVAAFYVEAVSGGN